MDTVPDEILLKILLMLDPHDDLHPVPVLHYFWLLLLLLLLLLLSPSHSPSFLLSPPPFSSRDKMSLLSAFPSLLRPLFPLSAGGATGGEEDRSLSDSILKIPNTRNGRRTGGCCQALGDEEVRRINQKWKGLARSATWIQEVLWGTGCNREHPGAATWDQVPPWRECRDGP